MIGHEQSEPRTAAGELAALAALPVVGQVHVWLVVALGAALLLLRAPQSVEPILLFVSLGFTAVAASARRIELPLSERAGVSIADATVFAALLVVGPDAAMVIACAASWAGMVVGPLKPGALYRTAFDMAASVVTVQAAGAAYAALGGAPVDERAVLRGLEAAIVGAAVTGFAVKSLVTYGGIAARRGWRAVPWSELAWQGSGQFLGAAAAGTAAFVIRDSRLWWSPLLVAPLLLGYRGWRLLRESVASAEQRVEDLSGLHLATVEALALAIDAKDQAATSHIRRVQIYALGVARALNMPAAEVEGVGTAALLHDIGKLAVPEHILSKPGPLTTDEFEKVKIHPVVGAEIIGDVPFPYPVSSLILNHHERWDGTGYPKGLSGEEIPLGARVLAVVDYYDALTSERPYHRTLSREEALTVIQQESGRALDPRVTEIFMTLLPALEAETARLVEPTRRLSFAAASDAAPLAAAPGTNRAFRDIALAHREIYALYELAQSMGSSLGVDDTMTLIASKLQNLVPLSASALFLYDEGTDSLTCRVATGVDADRLKGLSLKRGSGLVGWVARNLRPLVNARPQADFEAAGVESSPSLAAALVCPLTNDDLLVGVLAVYHDQPGCYSDDHRRLLDRVSEQAARVVQNSLLFEQTKHDSLTDPLTGLPNTRFMLMHLGRELARADRHASEVALLVMDLDGFKDINDAHGHRAGDRALREVARMLKAGTRPYDMCVRYAGDEFVVVLSGCGAEEAEAKKQELQQAIGATELEIAPGHRVSLGASFGFAVFPADGESYETLLATADRRMYENKSGRKLGPPPSPPPEPPARRPSVFAKIPVESPASRTH